jgi:hypothetical protein
MLRVETAKLLSPYTLLKRFLFAAVLGYVAYRLWVLDDFFNVQLTHFSRSLYQPQIYFWLISLLLFPINWLFEAKKWQVAVHKNVSITLPSALKIVLSSQAVNLLVPASLGHYAGRVFQTNAQGVSQLRFVSNVFVCQTMQMVVTVVMAVVGVCYCGTSMFSVEWLYVLLVALFAVAVLGFLFLKLVDVQWLRELKQGFDELSWQTWAEVGVYSLFRYLVFGTQFVLMLKFMGASLPVLTLFWAVSLVFMAKSLMPSIHFMGDLGVREFCALLFLPAIGLPETIVIGASVWVWLVNIMFPSVLGAGFLLAAKFK